MDGLTEREARNIRAVETLFAAWDRSELGYDDFLADECVYETAGFPRLNGKAAILAFLFGGGMQRVAHRYDNPRLAEIRRLQAEIIHLVARESLVITERIDHHFNPAGEELLTPRMAGIMEFDEEGRCISWRDYHDPAYFTGRPTTPWAEGPTALAPS